MNARYLAFLFLVLAGCHKGEGHSSHRPGEIHRPFAGKHPIKVVATTGMIGDLVRNVGGTHVQVTDLFKAGVDPHTYRPTTEDLRLLTGADIVFTNGLHLEGKMAEVLEKLGATTPSIPIADVFFLPGRATKSVSLLKDAEGIADPHIWFDVPLWSQLVGVVEQSLAKFDPAHAVDYAKQAKAYQERLATLDIEVRATLNSSSKERPILVTSHDAFQYFGRAYEIDVHGIQGISTDAEASVRDITNLVDFLVQKKVKAVFVESSVNPRAMQSLIEGCKARGHEVRIGGELFSDAMGESGTPEGTYEGMIRHNVKTLVNGLK